MVNGDVSASELSNVILSDVNAHTVETTSSSGFTMNAGCLDYDDDGICAYVVDEDDDCFTNVHDCAGTCSTDTDNYFVDDTYACTDGSSGTGCDCSGACNGTSWPSDCGCVAYDDGVTEGDWCDDQCDVPYGDDSTCSGSIYLGDYSAGSVPVYYSAGGEVGGFQFNITGADLSSATGGIAGEYGYSVSIGVNSMVLGFSFDGVQIPSGEGVLTNLAYTSTMNEACLIAEVLALGDWAGGFYGIYIGNSD